MRRRDPEAEGLVKPGLPAPAPFPAKHLGSRIIHHPLFLAQHKVPLAARVDRLRGFQSCQSTRKEQHQIDDKTPNGGRDESIKKEG